MVFALGYIELEAVFISLHRDLHVIVEKFLLIGSDGIEQLHILDAAVHHGTTVGRNKSVKVVVSALYRSLKQTAAVFAQEICKIISSDFSGPCVGRAEPCRESVADIQQRLGNILAGIAYADFPVVLRLPDQFVVCGLEKVFKVNQML